MYPSESPTANGIPGRSLTPPPPPPPQAPLAPAPPPATTKTSKVGAGHEPLLHVKAPVATNACITLLP